MVYYFQVRTHIRDLGLHILAINETELDDSIDDALLCIDGYSIRRCDRNRKGGGVALYIKDTILDKCSSRKGLPEPSLEALCLEVKSVQAAQLLSFAWYRPPNACMDIFHQLKESMQVLDRENKDILQNYQDGDSLRNNLPIYSMRILEFYNLFGFQQLIETDTREALLSSTLHGHIATNSKSNIVTSGVYETSISDHYLVYCVRKFHGACKKQHKYIIPI